MAFSTIQGSGGAPDSFVGTSGVDSITLINSAGNFFLGAQQANDFVSFANTSTIARGLIANAQIRAGDGNDTILGFGGLGGLFSSVNFNGNAGNDLINFAAEDSFVNSSIFGGQGNDTINTGTLSASVVNGNKGDDVITTTGIASNSSIYGGQGNDTINIDTAFLSSVASGDLGIDIIRTRGAIAVSGSTFLGGAGNDNINLSSVTTGTGALIDAGADADVVVGTQVADTILGGDGTDTITGGNGADLLTGGAGADQFEFDLASSVVATAVTTAASGGDRKIAVNDSITFGNGVDIITDFATATDRLNLKLDTAAVTLINQKVTDLDNDRNFFASGTFNAVTGVFTFLANGTGADTLIVQGGAGIQDTLVTNTSSVVLVGVNSNNFIAGNII